MKEITEAMDLFRDSLDRATPVIRGLNRSVESSRVSFKGLDSTLEDLNKTTGSVVVKNNTLKDSLVGVAGSLVAVGTALYKLSEPILRYNDLARAAARGTTLLGDSTEQARRNVTGLHRASLVLADAFGTTAEEATNIASGLMQDLEKQLGEGFDISSARSQIEDYAKSVGGLKTAMGISATDLTDIQKSLVGQAGFSLDEMEGIIGDMSGYAAKLGLTGADANEAIKTTMTDIMALDKQNRVEYVTQLLHNTAVQKRIFSDLGASVAEMASKRGTEAITDIATVASLSGRSYEEAQFAIQQAPFNAKAAEMLAEMQQAMLKSMIDVDAYKDIVAKSKSGPLTAAEASQKDLMEASVQHVTKMFGQPIEKILENIDKQSKAAQQPSMEEAKEAGRRMLEGAEEWRAATEVTADVKNQLKARIDKGANDRVGDDHLDNVATGRRMAQAGIDIVNENKADALSIAAGAAGVFTLTQKLARATGLSTVAGGVAGATKAAGGTLVRAGAPMVAGAGRAVPLIQAGLTAVDGVMTAKDLFSAEGREQVASYGTEEEWGIMSSLKGGLGGLMKPIRTISSLGLNLSTTLTDMADAAESGRMADTRIAAITSASKKRMGDDRGTRNGIISVDGTELDYSEAVKYADEAGRSLMQKGLKADYSVLLSDVFDELKKGVSGDDLLTRVEGGRGWSKASKEESEKTLNETRMARLKANEDKRQWEVPEALLNQRVEVQARREAALQKKVNDSEKIAEALKSFDVQGIKAAIKDGSPAIAPIVKLLSDIKDELGGKPPALA